MRFTFLIIKDYRQYHSLSSGPIGLAYLSAAAKARFPDMDIRIEVDPDQVIASRPDLIGVSAFTETYSQSIEAAHYIRKNLDVPIWLGGPHINALPLTLADCFDIGVVGEGEQTFPELLALFRTGKATPVHLKDIPGIVYWENGKCQVTSPRDPVQNLDEIIIPDRSIMKTFWPPATATINWPQPIYTSRGCPFKCVFCIYSMEQQKVRYHSVERVVAEIEDIIRYYPEQDKITIHDDLFTLSKKRLRELSKAIREAGIHKKVSFICMAKASVFDDEMALLLRDMNVSIITFGFESGVQRLLEYLKGPRCKVEENIRAIETCARHGIRVGGYFIVGTPHETYEELQQSYWFIRDHYPPMSMAGIFRLTPFPGTKYWEEALQHGIVSHNMTDWRPFNYADYQREEYFFFNDHYSLADFKFAYAHFSTLMERNNLGPNLETHEKQLLQTQAHEYRSLIHYIHDNAQILEITGFMKFSIRDMLKEEGNQIQIKTITPWDFVSAQIKQDYDLIICNFALEQMTQPAPQTIKRMAQYLKPRGQILFHIYNPLHSSIILRLLSGQWDSLHWGFRPFDFFQFITPQQLNGILQAHGLGIQEISPFQKTQLSVQQHQIIQLLLATIPGHNEDIFANFAYTILTLPKEDINNTHEFHSQTPVRSRSVGI